MRFELPIRWFTHFVGIEPIAAFTYRHFRSDPETHMTLIDTQMSMHYNIKHKNIKRHTAHTIVSWPDHKQWVIFHTCDLIVIIKKVYILSIITREMGKLKTHSPIHCIMDNWENMLSLMPLRSDIWGHSWHHIMIRSWLMQNVMAFNVCSRP